jgi:hypothetical protein
MYLELLLALGELVVDEDKVGCAVLKLVASLASSSYQGQLIRT